MAFPGETGTTLWGEEGFPPTRYVTSQIPAIFFWSDKIHLIQTALRPRGSVVFLYLKFNGFRGFKRRNQGRKRTV